MPSRGLRQGDPISPYLFLICFEWLSRALSHSVSSNQRKKLESAEGHLLFPIFFFADDSILFAKANIQNIECLKNTLEEYQYISGQRVNYIKSEVVFSQNVPSRIREFFVSFMGVS